MIVEPLRPMKRTWTKDNHVREKYRRRYYHYDDTYQTVAKLVPLKGQWPIPFWFRFSMPLELREDPEEVDRYCKNIIMTYCEHPREQFNSAIKSLPHEKDWSDWATIIEIELPVEKAKEYVYERQPHSKTGGLWRETLIIDHKTGETMQTCSAQNAVNWIWNYMLSDEERENLVYEKWFQTARRWGEYKKRHPKRRFELKYLSEKKSPPLIIPERHGLKAANDAAKAAAKWLQKKNNIQEPELEEEFDELAEIF